MLVVFGITVSDKIRNMLGLGLVGAGDGITDLLHDVLWGVINDD